MIPQVKICGLSTRETVDAALEANADYLGFVFYPPSPRYVVPEQAIGLASGIPSSTRRVGLFVDADDGAIQHCLSAVPLDILQLHGTETPERCQYLRRRFGRSIMKAIKIGSPEDVEAAGRYTGVVDQLLFDAIPPQGGLPGGNGIAFDWTLLKSRIWGLPWMLSGGLNADNVEAALRIAGASAVDVSSGVESAPGIKDPALIQAFIAKVKARQTA